MASDASREKKAGYSMLSEVHKPQRVFTIEEATRTLPLVGRVVRDIVAANEAIENLHAARQRPGGGAQSGESVDDGDSVYEFHDLEPDLDPSEGTGIRGNAAIDARIEDQVRKIDDCLREFESIGCQCTDFRMGLVDFPAMLDGRVVYLCWKLGESKIAHWHEVDGGFSGRRPVRGVF